MAKTTKKMDSLRMEKAKATIRMKDRARKDRKLNNAIKSGKPKRRGA